MTNIIKYKEFELVDIRVGTIISAEENLKLNNPSMILKIDFGEKIGIKKSSAKLIKNYKSEDLINKQIAAVVNFESKQIGNLISEVLVLGFPDNSNEPILIEPNKMIPNGGKLF
ncbi:tRNA-binding protein [Pelagibacteraceae bacterium]|nr:tRNA-binding protein [Pelagibacteraceae bacterium]